jgi:hypothetical protein
MKMDGASGGIEPTVHAENTQLIDFNNGENARNAKKFEVRIRPGYAEGLPGTELFLSKKILCASWQAKTPGGPSFCQKIRLGPVAGREQLVLNGRQIACRQDKTAQAD